MAAKEEDGGTARQSHNMKDGLAQKAKKVAVMTSIDTSMSDAGARQVHKGMEGEKNTGNS